MTRSRGGPGHGTLRWTRTGEQAGKGIITLVSCDKAFQDLCHSANEGTKVCTATHRDMYTWG